MSRRQGGANRGAGVLLCAVAAFAGSASAAEPEYRFEWVRTLLGPCCGDIGADIVVDAEGSVLVAGQRGGLDLDRDGSVEIQTYGSPDPVVLKSFDDDTELWVKGPGGPRADEARSLAVDRAGGAFVVGLFDESMALDSATIRSAGRRDGFLARYDADGETLWARAIGGVGHDQLDDVASDAEGNVYVVGTVRGAVDVDRDGTVDVEAPGESALLASFDPAGALRWAHSFAGPSSIQARSVALGPQGRIYVGGLFVNGALDLDGDGTPEGPAAAAPGDGGQVTPQTDVNGYFARFDPAGEMVWARVVSGPAVQVIGSLAVTADGDLLVLGGMTADTDLDGDGTIDLQFVSLGDGRPQDQADGNSFLLRVSPSGETRWSRRYSASVSHVAVGPARIAVSGTYSGALDLDDDGTPERGADPDPRLEGFVAILDEGGAVQQVFTVVGGDSDVVNAAAFSADGSRLYTTGYVKLGADFDGDDVAESASACHQIGDLYFARYELEPRDPSARRDGGGPSS